MLNFAKSQNLFDTLDSNLTVIDLPITWAPTLEPTWDPTSDPTTDPTEQPTLLPTQSPLSVPETLKQNVDDKWKMDEYSQISLYFVAICAVSAVAVAFLFHKCREKKESKPTVQGQDYLSVLLYMTQFVDLLSDIVLTLQLESYQEYAATDKTIDRNVFETLFIVSCIFVFVPYLLNVISSVRVTQRIANDDSFSNFTKKFFQKRSSLYCALVLLSGGSFPTLNLLNSNLFSFSCLNAGLSSLQVAGFRKHHVFTTILLENAPQLVVQAILIFKLGITGTIVLISFSSSIFNIFMSILLSLVHYVLYRGQSDTKWTILLSWNSRSQGYGAALYSPSPKSSNADKRVSLNPLIKMGRRKSLAKELATIQFAGSGGVSFEVLAETERVDACLIHGVLQYESTQSDTALFASFADKKEDIKAAIIRAFEYSPKYTTLYDFAVQISQSDVVSPEEEMKLVTDLMMKLGSSEAVINQFENDLMKVTFCLFTWPVIRCLVPFSVSLQNSFSQLVKCCVLLVE